MDIGSLRLAEGLCREMWRFRRFASTNNCRVFYFVRFTRCAVRQRRRARCLFGGLLSTVPILSMLHQTFCCPNDVSLVAVAPGKLVELREIVRALVFFSRTGTASCPYRSDARHYLAKLIYPKQKIFDVFHCLVVLQAIFQFCLLENERVRCNVENHLRRLEDYVTALKQFYSASVVVFLQNFSIFRCYFHKFLLFGYFTVYI